jgi:hypothetical protein
MASLFTYCNSNIIFVVDFAFSEFSKKRFSLFQKILAFKKKTMIPEKIIIQSLSAEFNITKEDPESFMEDLSEAINYLVQNDFSRLVQILYRMDINESRLKDMLAEHPDKDAGATIAALIVERERQKKLSRKQLKRDSDIPDDEKW